METFEVELNAFCSLIYPQAHRDQDVERPPGTLISVLGSQLVEWFGND